MQPIIWKSDEIASDTEQISTVESCFNSLSWNEIAFACEVVGAKEVGEEKVRKCHNEQRRRRQLDSDRREKSGSPQRFAFEHDGVVFPRSKEESSPQDRNRDMPQQDTCGFQIFVDDNNNGSLWSTDNMDFFPECSTKRYQGHRILTEEAVQATFHYCEFSPNLFNSLPTGHD